ncbi:MAG: PDZ domain-containing protein [Planctomycetes bacterium]|nr:PDZ domain-containing protein [Planctomycetota bacterium]
MPAGMEVIRNGKRMKLAVTPKRVNRVALVQELSASMAQTRFRIGVELAAAEETLRVQLKLPQGQGVVVTNVIDDLPAAKAGIQKHDILLMLGDKPVASHEEFRDKLQEFGEKPIAIKLIREGKKISIEVTPQKHQEPAGAANRVPVHSIVEGNWKLDVVRPVLIEPKIKGLDLKVWTPKDPAGVATPADPQSRLQQLIAQVKELQNALEALGEDLKKQQPAADPAEKK